MNCFNCSNCDKFREKKDRKNYILDTNLEDYECNICLGGFLKDQIVTLLPCHHKYHKECIEYWFKRKRVCPICNINIKA